MPIDENFKKILMENARDEEAYKKLSKAYEQINEPESDNQIKESGEDSNNEIDKIRENLIKKEKKLQELKYEVAKKKKELDEKHQKVIAHRKIIEDVRRQLKEDKADLQQEIDKYIKNYGNNPFKLRIIDYLWNGEITLEEDGCVRTISSAAAKSINCNVDEVIGKHVEYLADDRVLILDESTSDTTEKPIEFSEKPVEPERATGKILIVNESRDTRDHLVYILKTLGYETITAGSPEVGIQKSILHKPDLIISEFVFSGRGSFQVINKLHASEETMDTPVLATHLKSVSSNPVVLGVVDFLGQRVTEKMIREILERYDIKSGDRVLVVDNDEGRNKLALKVLQDNSIEAAIASNTLEGAAKLAEFTPNLVIISLLLPGFEGFKLLSDLRLSEQFISLPVILIGSDTISHAELKQLLPDSGDTSGIQQDNETLKTIIKKLAGHYIAER